MSGSDDEHKEEERRSLGSKIGGFLKKNFQKGKLELVHLAGLGPKVDIVPAGEPSIHAETRDVELGWHPVAGFGGKWFAEQTGLGRTITKHIHHYPDPTQHWAVLVGDYVHELWMDEHLDIIYINEQIDRKDWRTYEVGKTTFNDQALREAGHMVIHNMRAKKAAYNLINNNCQNFAVELLEAIQVGAHRDFGTTFAIYQRATGKGAIRDLFAVKPEDEKQEVETSDEQRKETIDNAKKVMDEHTVKVDNHTAAP